MIRWGVLGPGNIAHKFCKSLKHSPDNVLSAVGSRSIDRAAVFASRYKAPFYYGSYRALVECDEVDAVYVATPHIFHKEHCLLALNAGKHVLCEKPLAINANEALQLQAAAKEKGLFLMEAFWSRFIPSLIRVKELLDNQTIGKIEEVNLEFCFRSPTDANGRLRNIHLGGGALLDIGIYPLNIARWLFGSYDILASQSVVGPSGVDLSAEISIGLPGGGLGTLYFSIDDEERSGGWIRGAQGTIKIKEPFFASKKLLITKEGEKTVSKFPFKGPGYHFEQDHVAHCLEQNWLESPILPLKESIIVLQDMDRLRADWGIAYPGEH